MIVVAGDWLSAEASAAATVAAADDYYYDDFAVVGVQVGLVAEVTETELHCALGQDCWAGDL